MAKSLFANNTDLARDKRFSFVTEDVVVGGSTLAVQSIVGFESLDTSSGQILCVGEMGNERTELVRTSNTTAQSPSAAYKWVYLRDTLSFDHPQDTKVYIIDWNRVETQWSATSTGTKSTLFAYPHQLRPDQNETEIKEVTKSSGFYFQRFNETVGDTNSDWSDPIPYSGYDDNMVFSIKMRAVRGLNEQIDGKIITHEFLNESLWEARRDYHQSPGKRPFRRKFNTVIGAALTGSYSIELPTDVENPQTAENVYGVRIGANQNMSYYDKKEWDYDFINIPHSTLDVPYTRSVSTSLWLANGRDFTQSGSVSVEGMNISYTKVTGSNNSLTITAHGSYPSASAGSDAWQNASYGLPDRFTVFATPGGSAYIYFNRPIDTAYVDQNIYADYYRTLLGYDSDADVLDEPTYDMFVPYLKAKIKARKTMGQNDILEDSDFKLYLIQKDEALKSEFLGTDIRISPDVDRFTMPD